ncbi:MAG: crossover junction endodeoxyribonuclease RuvC [Simkaniaceae bacterium]|nr:crossover junction endodeoxyribonuclease RuvC [Simkaniaceae bacterium]MCF7853136.1 crossover junction endodeoxyribonuclease RuvC [Simkaniaceae bacterium]
MPPGKKKIILGIDPGTRITGYGVIEQFSQKMTALDYGNIYAKSDRLETCYLIIFNRIEELISLHKPDAISVETQFVYKNVQSSMKLSMARAIVMLAAAKNNILLYEYAPRKAKMAVTGNGSASKHQIQKMIAMLLNLKQSPPEDAADALSLAICHAHHFKPGLNYV